MNHILNNIEIFKTKNTKIRTILQSNQVKHASELVILKLIMLCGATLYERYVSE
jgi:hypothetical protein